MDWQPIETAPKDGEFLVFWRTTYRIGRAVRRRSGPLMVDVVADANTHQIMHPQPACWAALPPPPAQK